LREHEQRCAIALDASHPIRDDRLELAGTIALYGVAGALQFSIAAAQNPAHGLPSRAGWRSSSCGASASTSPGVLLAAARVCGLTLVSAAFSPPAHEPDRLQAARG